MSARATAIAVVALLVLGVALIAQAWRMMIGSGSAITPRDPVAGASQLG
jgi:hypothetical protein